jgi:hypothetical protein
VTVRAVRLDNALLDATAKLLSHHGRLLLFASESPRATSAAGFHVVDTAKLTEAPSSQLVILRRS